MEQLLTVREAAGYLRVSQATMWRWCQEGRVPAFKIGHEWRVVTPGVAAPGGGGRRRRCGGRDDGPVIPPSMHRAESPPGSS